MKNENEELKYCLDRKYYFLSDLAPRVIFDFPSRYGGTLLAISGIINEDVEQTISGSILYLVGSFVNKRLNEESERKNFKILEKRLLNQMQNLNQTQNKEKTIR